MRRPNNCSKEETSAGWYVEVSVHGIYIWKGDNLGAFICDAELDEKAADWRKSCDEGAKIRAAEPKEVMSQ